MTETIDQSISVRTTIEALLKSLSQGLYEKEEAMNLALLTAIAGESIFLLGPPGVGKSLIARRLKFAFKDGISFEYLMSKFSTPDEVFGPVSIKKLKEEDKYERLTDRYLPGANIVFLDEIWKAGPAIQNALLTVLNEKIYRNGEEDVKVNVRGIITASNELPPKNANLAPIWDRFLLRLEVGNIRQFGNFLNMITDTKDVYKDDIPDDIKLKNETLDTWSETINEVEVPAEVLNVIQLLKAKLIEYNARPANQNNPIIIHDRRWKKIIRLLRSSAFLNGRQQVDLMDCFLMLHCLWERTDHQVVIRDMLTDAVAKHGYSLAVNLGSLKKEVQDFQSDVDQEIKIQHKVNEEQLMTFDDEYFQLEKEESKFQGAFITIKQYRALSIEDENVLNFYDKDKNLVNRIRTSKGKEVHTIVVKHDAKENVYKLTTKMATKTEVIMKKPHAVVQKYWDERHQRLASFIDKQLQNIEQNQPNALQGLEQNFFVASEYAEIVRKNMEAVRESLQNLKLQLEKLQFSYTHI